MKKRYQLTIGGPNPFGLLEVFARTRPLTIETLDSLGTFSHRATVEMDEQYRADLFRYHINDGTYIRTIEDIKEPFIS